MQILKCSAENHTTLTERKADFESREDKNILMRDRWKAIRILENTGLQNGQEFLCLTLWELQVK